MKWKGRIIFILKYLVVILTIGYIVYKIKSYEGKDLFIDNVRHFGFTQVGLLLLASLLAIPNWGLEAFKWKKIIGYVEPVDYKKSVHAVLSGLSVSLFTPNRIGDIPARSLFLQPQNRTKGMAASAFGSACQLATTVYFGLLGFVLMTNIFPQVSIFNLNTALTIGITILIILLAFIVWPNKFVVLLGKVPFLKKQINKISHFSPPGFQRVAIKIFTLSNARYILFFIQFYILVKVFNVDVSIVQGFIAISLSYFVMLFIPVISMGEVSVRGSAAIYCFGLFTQQVAGILLATFSLWIINIALPALVGSYFLKMHKFSHPN